MTTLRVRVTTVRGVWLVTTIHDDDRTWSTTITSVDPSVQIDDDSARKVHNEIVTRLKGGR